MTANGDEELPPVQPEELFKQVAMPGWVELHVRQITVRTQSAKRYAACAVDAWEGVHTADQTTSELNPPGMPKWPLRKAGKATRLTETTQAAVQKRRELPVLTENDMKSLRSMHDSIEGKLAYSAAVIAADIETSPAWNDQYFSHHHSHIDLFRQVADVSASARDLLRAKTAIGPKPPHNLANDPDVMEVFRHHTHVHQRRLDAIALRVQTFLHYRDNIRACEVIIEKRRWLAEHDHHGDLTQLTREATDSLAGADLRRATEEVEHNTAIALGFLVEDVRRLSRVIS